MDHMDELEEKESSKPQLDNARGLLRALSRSLHEITNCVARMDE